jgi:heat shock protein HslJ
MNRFNFIIMLTFLIATLTACSKEAPSTNPPAPSSKSPAETMQVPEAPPQAEDVTGPLGDTSWRLVKIMSMDDTTYVPDDPSLYTMKFGVDGSVSLLADCNRGTGTWTSESDSQLQFGPIAATMAMCPPGSLHDRYMAQFEWVRSYTMSDGHLFLATMADGAIIEFEPLGGD